jgi:hypothetical protein
MLSSQNFADAGTFRSGNTVFTGVPVGAATYLPGTLFTPQVALANFSAKPVNATVQFARTTDSGPEASAVATVSVPAMSSQTIALPLLTGDPGMRNSFIVQSDAAPGSLFASVASVGAPGFGLVEQIGKDQQTLYNGGGHPWDLSGGQDAVLLLFNHSAAAKYFNVKVGSGGVLWQQPQLLAPMETRAISIRDLIAGQVKDQDGKVLPRSLEQGEIGWFNVHPGEGKGRLMQIDPASQTVAANSRAVARNFSCSYAFVLCGGSINPYSVSINVGQSSGTLEAVPSVCLGNTPSDCNSTQASSYGGLGYTYEWGVDGPAEVNGSYTQSTATIQGTGAGTGWVDCDITCQNNGYTCRAYPQATLTVNCSYPTGETTTWSGWDQNIFSLGKWEQVLSPAGPWSGRTVTESDAAPGTDNCYFTGSQYAPQTSVLTPGVGHSWLVGTSNQWGYDEIGWTPAAIIQYYQIQRPQRGLTLPCEADLFQKLTITCPNGPTQTYRGSVPLRAIISATGVSSGRDGQLQGEIY